MEIEDKIYYLRVILAAIAGSILGVIVKPNSDHSNTIGLTILIGIIFYAISQIIASRIAKGVPKDKKKKGNYDCNIWIYFHAIYLYGFDLHSAKPKYHLIR